MSSPDLAAAAALADHAAPRSPRSVLANQAEMCVVCGADQPGELAERCSACGSPAVLVPDLPVAHPPFGALHLRRAAVRKRWAMVVGQRDASYILLTHNGKPAEIPLAELPAAVEPELRGFQLTPRSPVGRILRYAVAVGAGAVDLGWPADLLMDQAFSLLTTMSWAGRATALDALALGRPDLLHRCALSPTEIIWLNLVNAAGNRDCAGLVQSAAALPADRYRHKIAILAVFARQLGSVPGAAAMLGPALDAYGATEPLAVILRRRLGLAASTPRQRLDDAALLAARLGVPDQIRQLAGSVSACHANGQALGLLGERGRLAVLHGNPALTGELPGSINVAGAPLAILDDLVDAGAVSLEAITGSARSAADKTYLTGRIAPDQLSDDQVAQLEHHPERARRRFLAGESELDADESGTAVGRHIAALDLLLRNRPQDVPLDDILPAHREVAKHLIQLLTAALAGEKPAQLLNKAVLDDHTSWQPLVRIFGTDRLRDGGDELARRHSEFFEWLSIVAAREQLFLADWYAGTQSARQCLELASAEPILDEAHNLLACGLHNLGDHAGALAALQVAIEGEYSVALLANIGVVAAQLDPRLAAEHLARIVREAPTAAMRANAARRALDMWQSDRVNVWHGAGDDELPMVLREPLRSVVVDDIGLDDFRLIVSAIARFDQGWLQVPTNLARSPHRNSLEAKYHQARAANDMFMSTVDVLATIRDWSAAPPWLREERDRLVWNTVEYLTEHLNDPDNTAGVIAKALYDKVAGLPTKTRAELALLAVASLTYHVSEQGKEISDGLVATYHDAERIVTASSTEDRVVLDQLVELSVRRIALNLLEARRQEHNALVDPYNEALRVLGVVQRGQPIWFEARHVVAELVQSCRNARDQLKPWLRKLDDAGVREDLMDFLELCQETEIKAERVLNG